MKNKEKVISKEETWKGIKMKLPIERLHEICQANFEEDKYYNFSLLKKGMYNALNQKVDFEYYKVWCILIANCFSYTNYKNKKLQKLIDDIAYFIDGCSFEDEYDIKELFEDIAYLKYYNHKYENLVQGTNLPFETKGIERFLAIDHCNWASDSCVYNVIIRNNNKKQFDKRYVDDKDFLFSDRINYTFVDKNDIDTIFSSFFNGKWEENHNLIF